MTVVILHLVATSFLCGLIWTIQVLHYPAFEEIREESFKLFHETHSSRITFIVGPVMLTELVTSLMLLAQFPGEVLFKINLALLLLIWVSTGLVSVPLHNRLAISKSSENIRKLVRTNWPRTVLWNMRLIGLCWYCYGFLR